MNNDNKDFQLSLVIKKNSTDSFVTINTDPNTLNEKHNTNDILKKPSKKLKRRYFTRILWLISLISIILYFIFFDKFLAMVLSFTMIGVSAMFNMLMYFISPKKINFSIDAYITIIISYSIALVKLVIIPLDISTSLSVLTNQSANIQNNNKLLSEYKSIHDSIDLIWKIIYWTSIVLNFIVMRFQIAYWSQGHPTIKQKIINVFKLFLKQIIVISVMGIITLIFLLIKYSSIMEGLDFITSIIQIINLIYCLSHIVFLLGYGLVQLPFFFFSYTNSSVKLKYNIKSLNKIRQELEDGVNKLIKDNILLTAVCCNIIKKEAILTSKENTIKFAKDILVEIKEYNFEINDLILYKAIPGNIKEPKFNDFNKEINDDILAQMLITIKNDFSYCCKKEAALLRNYASISNNCEALDDTNLSSIILNPKKSANKKTSFIQQRNVGLNKKIYFLLPKNHSFLIKIFTKIIAFFLIGISIIFLVFQINLFFLSYKNLVYFTSNTILQSNFYLNYLFVFFYFFYFFICCFYALSKFKFFEIYILIAHHTNKFGMAFNSSMCNTLVLGICYNILYFYSNIYDGESNNDYSKKTSTFALNAFFNSMKKVEFIYGYYNIFFPSILLVVISFTLMRKFKFLCFKSEKLNDLEVDIDPILDRGDNEIISEDTFFKDGDTGEKIKFDILEKIHNVYFKDT